MVKSSAIIRRDDMILVFRMRTAVGGHGLFDVEGV